MLTSKKLVSCIFTIVIFLTIGILANLFSINVYYTDDATECVFGDWFCILTYSAFAVTIACMTVLSFCACGLLWWRGGIYKFVQIIALLLPAVAWATVLGLLLGYQTQYQNKARGYPTWPIWLLVGLVSANTAALAIATLARMISKPGKAVQGELNEEEALRRARRRIDYYKRLYGAEYARMKHVVQRTVDEEMGKVHMTMSYGHGCVPDEPGDANDAVYIPRHPRWYGDWLLPKHVDLSTRPYMPLVLNQQSMGTCAAHATVNAYRFALVKEAGVQAYMPSRMFIYHHATVNIQGKPLGCDTGTSVRSAFEAVMKFGACEEHLFPYNERSLHRYPPPEAISNARKWRSKKLLTPIKLFPSGEAIKVDPDQKIYTIMSALARGHPLVVAMQLRSRGRSKDVSYAGELEGDTIYMEYPDDADMYDLEHGNCKNFDGHAVLLVGYLRQGRTGWFKFQNSWGEDSHENGYFYVPFPFMVHPRLTNAYWMFND